MTGWTSSTDFPTTVDAYDTSYNSLSLSYSSNYGDVFISKLDGNLSANTAGTIEAAPKQLLLNKYSSDDVTITVKDGNYLVRGATVTATIRGNGNKIIAVLPASETTDNNGQAVFAISSTGKKGTAVIRFSVKGMSKSTTVKVKVR